MQTNILTPQAIFFSVVRYDIPAFQRPYIWTQDQQWEPLWEDVSNLAEEFLEAGQVAPHFLGAIVLQQRLHPSSRSIGTRIVVDGQQRLTTLQLLIDAVQEVCERRGHRVPALRLSRLVRTEQEYWDDDPDFEFKVWPTAYDRTAFRHAMHNDLPSDEYKNSRIVAAHNFFKNKTELWLDEYSEDDGQRDIAAAALENAVSNSLELVVIDLGTSDDPHVIFETLNARGTPLLPSDMIKNQILHKADVSFEYDENEDLPEEAKKLWSFGDSWWRQEVGRGYQRRPRVDVYLNNWLTLRNRSETKPHDEFTAFSKYVNDSEKEGTSIHKIAEDIGKLGTIYRDIDQENIENIKIFLHRRGVMGIGAVTPFLLWLLSSDVPTSQFDKSISALESYLMRRMVCGMGARSYGQLFVGLINELETAGTDYAGDTVVGFLSEQTAIANLWPDDEALRDTFLTKPLYGSLAQARINLLLRGIESELRSALSETQEVGGRLHIEHIMPQGWVAHWPIPADAMDKDIAVSRRNRAIHTIGNLTLVTQPLNSTLSNAPWEQKRETLDRHSVLFLNKDLTQNAPSAWDESEIIKRGERLFDAAVRIWPHSKAIS